MVTILEQIEKIEEEIRKTPYHKKTEQHIGILRAKLSKLKSKEIEISSKKSGGRGGYAIKKQGDATVTLVGEPSVGKSTLLNKLTDAKSKIAPYSFTTVSVIPGMMNYKDAHIQILDVPGLIEGSEKGKGHGKEVLSVVRGSDLLIILCDAKDKSSLSLITESLEKSGIRINKYPPNIIIDKKVRGGINIISNIKQSISYDAIGQIAKEFRVVNADITIKGKLTINRLIDAFSTNIVYIPTIYVINKIDLVSDKKRVSKYKDKEILYISAKKGIGLNDLRKSIWQKLNLVRVYLVKIGEKASNDNPIIIKTNTTLKKVAQQISTEFAEDKKRAKIWGPGAKFPGQEVSLHTKTKEGMMIRFL